MSNRRKDKAKEAFQTLREGFRRRGGDLEVLGPARKYMEVAVISRTKFNKEILVRLKCMEVWDMIQPSFPLECVTQYCMRRIENKSEINYCSFYTMQCFESRQLV